MNALRTEAHGLALCALALLPPGDDEAALPAPTGPHAVGTTTFHLVDDARPDPVDAARPRELLVQVWYPAEAGEPRSRAPYLVEPGLVAAVVERDYLDLGPDTLLGWEELVTEAAFDAPLSTTGSPHALVLVSPGFGLARASYTALSLELASHGLVVAAIDHPYAGLAVLPDGRELCFTDVPRGDPVLSVRRVEALAGDHAFVLAALLDEHGAAGRFAAHLDPERAAVLGHSLGGAAALESCRTGGRFRACVDLDGDPWGRVEEEGVRRPALVVLNVPAPSHQPPEALRHERDRRWEAVLTRGGAPGQVLKVAGTFHYSFTDVPFLVTPARLHRNGATLAPLRCHELVARAVRSFLAEHLPAGKSPDLEELARTHEELTLVTHRGASSAR